MTGPASQKSISQTTKTVAQPRNQQHSTSAKDREPPKKKNFSVVKKVDKGSSKPRNEFGRKSEENELKQVFTRLQHKSAAQKTQQHIEMDEIDDSTSSSNSKSMLYYIYLLLHCRYVYVPVAPHNYTDLPVQDPELLSEVRQFQPEVLKSVPQRRKNLNPVSNLHIFCIIAWPGHETICSLHSAFSAQNIPLLSILQTKLGHVVEESGAKGMEIAPSPTQNMSQHKPMPSTKAPTSAAKQASNTTHSPAKVEEECKQLIFFLKVCVTPAHFYR